MIAIRVSELRKERPRPMPSDAAKSEVRTAVPSGTYDALFQGPDRPDWRDASVPIRKYPCNLLKNRMIQIYHIASN